MTLCRAKACLRHRRTADTGYDEFALGGDGEGMPSPYGFVQRKKGDRYHEEHDF